MIMNKNSNLKNDDGLSTKVSTTASAFMLFAGHKITGGSISFKSLAFIYRTPFNNSG
jgi:hypothetical protein